MLAQKKYFKGERGNRLNPNRSHPRYWVLTSLRNNLVNIINQSFQQKINILDFGCGNKPYKELFKDISNSFIGADIEGNESADIIINMNGTLPSPDKSFDCVLSTQVLEHVENPKLYLDESFRVLKDNGILILSTHGFWQYHPDPTDYWRWTSAGLKKIIAEAGFTIENIYSIQSLPTISLQLWLDATLHKVPRLFKKLYSLIFQLVMEMIDKRIENKFSENASVFIVVAKKKL